jgi:hypothetical protein
MAAADVLPRENTPFRKFAFDFRTKHEHTPPPIIEEADMTGFVREVAALISVTVFVASIGVLSELVRLLG